MCLRGYGGNGVYGSLWECMGKYMSAHKCIQYTWVYVSVVSLCDCKEFLWFSWVYVSECEGYDCIWVYLTVFESMGVYVSVFECLWILWVYLSVVWTLTLQLFPEPHTEFRHHRSTSIQTHPPRFRIPARTVTKIGIWIFPNTPKSAGWWANFGIFHELTKPAYWSPTHLHQL
jgi:hypothetical protein